MPAGAIALADITSADWSLALGAIGDVVQGIADVEQCLGIIVTTPRGSDGIPAPIKSSLHRVGAARVRPSLP